MANVKELIQELNFLSDKLSERVRVISAGVIAIWWATLIGDKVPPGVDAKALLGPVIAAAISLLIDVLQYLIGYYHNRYALHFLEKSGDTDFKYNSKALIYKSREFLFALKLATTIVATMWLISILVRKFWP